MTTDAEIWQMIQDKKYEEANTAIRERLSATNLTEKQVGAMMYYAYEQGHAYGEHEVLHHAMTMLTDIAEAK
jgi:hypothetical protein